MAGDLNTKLNRRNPELVAEASFDLKNPVDFSLMADRFSLVPLVIDSGATSTVCGLSRFEQWTSSCSTASKPVLEKSEKSFKFGDSRRFVSIGVTQLDGVVQTMDCQGRKTRRKIRIISDVVDTSVPLLLSMKSIANLQVSMDFVRNII